jgi:hypothetical protein
MKGNKDPAVGYFDSSVDDVRRACFESGIALATLYHSLLGLPVRTDRKQLELIERAFETMVMNQPYRRSARVRIVPKDVRIEGKDAYDYQEIRGDWLELEVVVGYGRAIVVAKMSYVKEMNYPLMRISSITEESQNKSHTLNL